MCTVFENNIKSRLQHCELRSYVYILSGQKLIKNTKNSQLWRVFENLKFASLVRQVTFNRTKMPKLKNLSAVFCVICKLCALAQFLSFWSLWRLWLSNVAHLQLFPAVRTRTSYCRYFFKSDTMGNHSSNTRNEGN